MLNSLDPRGKRSESGRYWHTCTSRVVRPYIAQLRLGARPTESLQQQKYSLGREKPTGHNKRYARQRDRNSTSPFPPLHAASPPPAGRNRQCFSLCPFLRLLDRLRERAPPRVSLGFVGHLLQLQLHSRHLGSAWSWSRKCEHVERGHGGVNANATATCQRLTIHTPLTAGADIHALPADYVCVDSIVGSRRVLVTETPSPVPA